MTIRRFHVGASMFRCYLIETHSPGFLSLGAYTSRFHLGTYSFSGVIAIARSGYVGNSNSSKKNISRF